MVFLVLTAPNQQPTKVVFFPTTQNPVRPTLAQAGHRSPTAATIRETEFLFLSAKEINSIYLGLPKGSMRAVQNYTTTVLRTSRLCKLQSSTLRFVTGAWLLGSVIH